MVAPRLLDLCCGAGLAADGYADAGVELWLGVDINPQAEYPYHFSEGDALITLDERAWIEHCIDAVHASFPCQAHTRAKHLRTAQGGTSRFDDLLTPGLDLLRQLLAHLGVTA